VELHGGAVNVETSEELGTTITCQFPLTPLTHFQTHESD